MIDEYNKGYTEGYAQALKHCQIVAIPQAEKQARRDVVEWLETEWWQRYTDPSGTYHWMRMRPPGAMRLEVWQNKLKEWGLE